MIREGLEKIEKIDEFIHPSWLTKCASWLISFIQSPFVPLSSPFIQPPPFFLSKLRHCMAPCHWFQQLWGHFARITVFNPQMTATSTLCSFKNDLACNTSSVGSIDHFLLVFLEPAFAYAFLLRDLTLVLWILPRIV